MTTLVVGASGATGRLLVGQLLKRGEKVRIIVRSPNKLPEFFKKNDNVSVIPASVLDLSDDEMTHHVKGCVKQHSKGTNEYTRNTVKTKIR